RRKVVVEPEVVALSIDGRRASMSRNLDQDLRGCANSHRRITVSLGLQSRLFLTADESVTRRVEDISHMQVRSASSASHKRLVGLVIHPMADYDCFARCKSILLRRYAEPYAITALHKRRPALSHPLEVAAIEFAWTIFDRLLSRQCEG